MRIVKEVLEFNWDKGNIDKNKKHDVEDKEAEEPFLDENKVIFIDAFHLEKEKRFVLIGKTKNKRVLYMVFTKRNKKIRIISARDINRKEVHLYEKKISVT
ncbi:MAG: BrnT family toxin [Candidatus Daviesbacteria bacterium]|nr:BrnT family toxin [Candidatus Daviesbacteria bacterium]